MAESNEPPSEPPETESTTDESRTLKIGPLPAASRPGDGMPSTMDGAVPGFRLLRRLGTGGMGIVFEAEQDTPRRRVALKVLKGSLTAGEDRLRLLEREAQVLALLKHPGIATLHQTGWTVDGQPFFVMELVDGVPLSRYADDHPLPPAAGLRRAITERVRLVQQICDAVSHAHQRGVIHRDLKPNNVMVTASVEMNSEPKVKVLDFGLARLTGDASSMVGTVNEAGGVHGTLPYMSPEQASGTPDSIDVRTDVYALGVVLYELLTGERPIPFENAGLADAVRRITDQDPIPPATLVPALRGDLETILLKCLEKDPDRRYQSVAAVKEDLDRFLRNLPILARAPGTGYLLRKLIARHRVPFFMGSALVVLVLVFGIAMTFLFAAQRAERTRAEREADKAGRINVYLQSMLEKTNPYRSGEDLRVSDLLEAALEELPELDREPEVRAAVLSTIGNAYVSLGRYRSAEPLLRESLGLRSTSLDPPHPELAGSLTDLAVCLLNDGKTGAEVESLATASLAMRRTLYGADHPETATGLNDLGRVMDRRGRSAEAESLYVRAAEIVERSGIPARSATENLLNRGVLHLRAQEFGAAEEAFGDAVRASRPAREEDPFSFALAVNALAALWVETGRCAEAESLLEASLPWQLERLGPRQPNVLEARTALALSLQCRGGFPEAERILRDVLRIQQDAGAAPQRVLRTQSNLAFLLHLRGDERESEDAYRSCLRSMSTDSPEYRIVQANLAAVLRESRRFSGAESLLVDVLGNQVQALGRNHPRTGETMHALGATHLDAGRPLEAESLLRNAVETLEAASHPRAPFASSDLGSCLAELGRWEEALALLETSRPSLLDGERPVLWRRESLRRTLRAWRGHQEEEEIARLETALAEISP